MLIASSGSGRVWPLRIVSFPTYSVFPVCSLWVSLTFQALWLYHSPVLGALLKTYIQESACTCEQNMFCTFPLCMLHCLIRLQVQDTRSKIKLLRTSREQQQSIKPSRAHWEHCAAAQVTCPWSPPWNPFQTLPLPPVWAFPPWNILDFFPSLKPDNIPRQHFIGIWTKT